MICQVEQENCKNKYATSFICKLCPMIYFSVFFLRLNDGLKSATDSLIVSTFIN